MKVEEARLYQEVVFPWKVNRADGSTRYKHGPIISITGKYCRVRYSSGKGKGKWEGEIEQVIPFNDGQHLLEAKKEQVAA